MTESKIPDDEQERHVRLIHKLATRLPWIVINVTLLTALATIIEVLWHRT